MMGYNIGGKVIYLECSNTAKLVDFYHANRFRDFGIRKLGKHEEGVVDEEYLVQMLKYLS